MWFFGWKKNKKEVPESVNEEMQQEGVSLAEVPKNNTTLKLLGIIAQSNNVVAEQAAAMDGDSESRLKMSLRSPEVISQSLADWFSSNSFVGYPMCAILSQNWLIGKACFVPARDATRNGYDIISMNGDEIPDETVKILQQYDKRFKIKKNCEEFVGMGRVFGVRIALFEVESSDPEFYEKPFNLDGVEKGAYKGVSQIDPTWCTPVFVSGELNNPAARNFYEPTYWMINGKKYHRSHLIVFRNGKVPDILKPLYMYGGYPLPQLIMNRVYSAERTADESLGLVTSKRTTFWQTNLAMFMSNEDKAKANLQKWIAYRDNYGIKVGDKIEDQLTQFDTTLSGLDDVIMTNYQVVSAASNVPATKLLGTSPKGFSSGEEESKNYYQELESIQEHDLTELVERHHQLAMKSSGVEVLDLTVSWRPVDSPTAKELAERNKAKADTFSSLVMSGVFEPEEIRTVIVKDPDFGFHDIGNRTDDVFDEETQKALKELGINLNEET